MLSIDIELILLRAGSAGLRYRAVRFPLRPGATPDESALAVATDRCGVTPDVCHSTSWRYEPSGALWLTYATLPDVSQSTAGVRLVAPAVLSSGDPLRPTPIDVHDHHVAAHAVRHLALLSAEDPAVRSVAATDPDTWSLIRSAADRMPTDTHAEAHAAAEPAARAS